MDPQVLPAHQHAYEEDPHNRGLHAVIEGEDEHHEKKSVIKKVKDKAKKLKDTLGIKKHGHGHEGDHDQEVEDDEDEEEIERDPEVQGAPMYEVTTARIVLHMDTLGHSGANSGPKSQFPPLEKDPQAPRIQFEPSDPGNHRANTIELRGPGGKEAGVTPLIGSFGKMEISNEGGEHKPLSSTETMGENPQAVPKSLNTRESENHSQGSEVQEQPNQSSYTEKISTATSIIAEKAKSAKNAVASAPVGEYGSKVAATVTEKLAPVYEKVAEAGSAVVSKIQGTGTETEGKDVGGTNKGVSVKEYVAEKLRPSDEDKALSEVITEVLHKRKGEEPQESQQKGKVTDSPELAGRLGADSDGNKPEGFSPGNETGKGTVDWLKGAVRSWLGKNGEQQQRQQHTSQESQSSSGGGDEVERQDITGERRLNESTN